MFEPEQFLEVELEKWRENPFTLMKELEMFLNLDSEFDEEDFVTDPQTKLKCYQKHDLKNDTICSPDYKTRSRNKSIPDISNSAKNKLENFYAFIHKLD